MEQLDPTDTSAVADYERAFFAAFQPLDTPPLRQLWSWKDAEGRIASAVPYRDQCVLLARDAQGRISIALAANTALRMVQASAFGFPRPREGNAVEFLTFFSRPGIRLAEVLAFWRSCFADLRHRGITCGYATANERMCSVYRRCGATLIGQATVEGYARYYLRFDTTSAILGNVTRPRPDRSETATAARTPLMDHVHRSGTVAHATRHGCADHHA